MSSFENNLPVFTMNFDPMFEEAAESLHIPFKVYTHRDNLPPDDGYLHICKLHGDISEEITTQTICTTIDSISRRNEKWLNYIAEFAKKRNICFLGYSGRDIDYFPRFCEMDIQRPFWIPVRDNIETIANAGRIGAESLSDYPNEYFEKNFSISDLNAVCEESKTTGKDAFLQEISNKIPDISFDPEVFWIHLMRSTGNIQETQRCIKDGKVGKLTNIEKYIFLNEEGTVFREQANFTKYRESYERIKALSIADGNESERLNAEFQIISSYQMTIPQEDRMPWWMILRRRPDLLLKVMGMFADFLRKNKSNYDGNEGIIQEALIRNLAIYARIADAGFIPSIIKMTAFNYYKNNCLSISDFVGGKRKTAETDKETYWLEFRDILSAAEMIGNISGINSCMKYMRRPGFKKYADRDGKPDNNVSTLVSTITHDQSAKSNDIAHSGGKISEAIQGAIENDNVLNVVKFILKSAQQEVPGWEKNADLYFQYADRIEPQSLKNTYRLLGKKYLKKTKSIRL